MTAPVQAQMPAATTFEIPGWRVTRNLGVAFGLVVRSVGFARGFTGGIRSLSQGEVPEYTQVLEDARRHAIYRMLQNARLLGANGVVAMRFDSVEMGQGLAEIIAYGSAVVVEPAPGHGEPAGPAGSTG